MIALDGIAYGIHGLEALVVIHLGDAHIHAAFVREGAGIDPGVQLAAGLRDAFRTAQVAARRFPAGARRRSSRPAPPQGMDAELPDPVVTIEIEGAAVLLHRVRAYVVASAFDATLPLGMARLVASRLAATLSHELPRGDAPDAPEPRASRAEIDGPTDAEARNALRDRTRRLLALLDTHAPQPHIARLRVALRAGLTPLALERLEGLGADAMLLIETAIEDVVGLDRAALRRLV